MLEHFRPIPCLENDGFSLVEIMITLAVLLLALSTAFGVMISQRKNYKDENELIEMSQNTRASVDILMRELRLSGYKTLETDFLGYLSNWVSSEYLPAYPYSVDLTSGSCPIITEGGGTSPDMITLFIADLKENKMAANTASGSTTIALDPNAPGFSGSASAKFRVNDIIRIGDHTEFAKVTGISGNSLTIDTNPSTTGNQGLANSYNAGEYIREVNVVSYTVINEENDSSHQHHTVGHPVLKRKINEIDYADVAEDIEDMQIIPHAPPRYKLQLTTRTSSQGDYVDVDPDGYKRTELVADFRLRNFVKSTCLAGETPVITSLTGLNSSLPCNINVAWSPVVRDIRGNNLSSDCAVTDYVVTYAPTPDTRFYTAYPGNTTSCELNISEILRDANYSTNIYYVSVAAVNCGGLSAYSAEQTISDTSSPGAVTDLTAATLAPSGPDGHSIVLNWTGNPECDVVAYRIYRSTSYGGPFDANSLIFSDPNVDIGITRTYTYQDINLPCETYYYVVKAFDLRYESTSSNQAYATVADSNSPAGPSSFSFTKEGSTVNLHWTISVDDPSDGWGDNDVIKYNIYALFLGGEIPLNISIPAGQSSKSINSWYTNFGIKSIDLCDNTSVLITQTSCPNPPVITINSPSAGSTVAGSVTINGSASSSNALIRVKARINADPWVTAAGTASWSYTWNTLGLTNGTYTITAEVLDIENCSGRASLDVIVQNGP